MAEEDSASKALNSSFFQKKLGPLPAWVWIGGALLVWYFLIEKKGGSLLGSGSATPNQQTDPAGNIGTIDPATGYVYGTPEDLAALASSNAGITPPASGGGGGGTTGGAQTYADNTAWASAAINYLVASGVDPTTANEAVTEYLAGQALTTEEQADINLAIQAVGSPPSLPGPSGPVTPIVTPPGGAGTCPSGYTFSATQTGASGETPASGGTGWCELKPATTTTPPAPTTTSVTVTPWTSTPGPGGLAPWSSTLWGIATHFNVPGGYEALAKLNGISNPNVIQVGQVIKVPVAA